MKSLGKLKVNSEKVLKDDELRSLKGGDCNYTCCVDWGIATYCGTGCGGSADEATEYCRRTYVPMGANCWCF